MSEKTCLEIIEDYLIAKGYDGLYNDDCGCFLADLVPCSSDFAECRPGIKIVLRGDEDECVYGIGPKTEPDEIK